MATTYTSDAAVSINGGSASADGFASSPWGAKDCTSKPTSDEREPVTGSATCCTSKQNGGGTICTSKMTAGGGAPVLGVGTTCTSELTGGVAESEGGGNNLYLRTAGWWSCAWGVVVEHLALCSQGVSREVIACRRSLGERWQTFKFRGKLFDSSLNDKRHLFK